jgi:hypothetical protein
MPNRPVHERGAITDKGYLKLPLPSLRRVFQASDFKILAAIARVEMGANPNRVAAYAPEPRAPLTAFPSASRTKIINRKLIDD